MLNNLDVPCSFDDDAYYLMKFQMLMLVMNNHEKLVKDDYSLISFPFIASFIPFIDAFLKKNLLSHEMRENFLRYLNVARFSNGNKKLNSFEQVEENLKITVINKLIAMVNSQDYDDSMRYYRYQMCVRTDDKIYLNRFKVTDADILDEKDDLFESMAYDCFVLYTHSVNMSLNDFQKIITDISKNQLYYETITCILNEYPYQFLNKVFYDRCQMVLSKSLEDSRGIYAKNIRSLIKNIDKVQLKLKKRS